MDLPSSSLLDTNNLVSILKIGTLQNELLYLGILKWFGEIVLLKEESEDTEGVIIIRKSKKNRQHKDNNKNTKGQTTIYKIYI
jgi:hypothetical protein